MCGERNQAGKLSPNILYLSVFLLFCCLSWLLSVCLRLYQIYSSIVLKITLRLLRNKYDPASAKTFPVSARTRCLSFISILKEDFREYVKKVIILNTVTFNKPNFTINAIRADP